MIRVKPDKIRYSNAFEDYWVLNGDKDEMRPYRILIKEFIERNYEEVNTINNYDANIHYINCRKWGMEFICSKCIIKFYG